MGHLPQLMGDIAQKWFKQIVYLEFGSLDF